MESEAAAHPRVEASDAQAGAPDDARHRPFRAWALQQDVIRLLGSEPEWRERSTDLGLEELPADDARNLRGQSFLREELEPDPEFSMRTKTSIALWASALITDSLNQYGPTGLKMDTGPFTITIVLVIVALIFTSIVYPRLSARAFPIVEQTVLTGAMALIAYQCSVTGGAGSPYAVWLLFTVFYTGYFHQPRQVYPNAILASAIALAPLVYDSASREGNLPLVTCVLVVALWALALTVLYRRQLGRGAERAVKFLALADPLTGVANLRAFETMTTRLTDEGDREFSLVMVDMNGLKGANAVFGFDVGDAMVSRLARLLLQVSDPEDQVFRIGGDEFAVVLFGGADAVETRRERFDVAAEAHNAMIRGRMPQISVASGSASYPEDGETTEELVDAADRRMYDQKAPAVQPPHVVSGGAPVNAARLLRDDPRDAVPSQTFEPAEFAAQTFMFWLLGGLFAIGWTIIPGGDVPHPTGTLILGAYALLVAAFSFVGRTPRYSHLALRVNDFSLLVTVIPAIWITGGWESPLQLFTVLSVAIYSEFLRGIQAGVRVAAVIGMYTIAFWTSGTPSPAGQSLFATIVTAQIVISLLLQFNARATDNSLAVVRDSATHDALTGVNNLRAFRRDIASVVADAETGEETHLNRPALVIADIDEFRNINTIAGHLGGDAILREAVRRLDTARAGEGKLYRLGGDEFALLFKVDRFAQASAKAERCRRALNFNPPTHVGLDRPVAASIGFAVWRNGMPAEAFLQAVETVLGESKSRSGDSVSAGTNVML